MAWDHSLAVDWLNKSLQMEMQFPTGIPIAKIYANMAEMYEEASTNDAGREAILIRTDIYEEEEYSTATGRYLRGGRILH